MVIKNTSNSAGVFDYAIDRVAYLTTKSTAYKKLRDDDWFTSLIKKAEDKDEDGTLILAKMYKHGLGVKKRSPYLQILTQQFKPAGKF